MLFSSVTFLFAFLPILFILYLLCPAKGRNILLLLASIFFYAWGEPRYVFIMLATIIINYFGALAINKWHAQRTLILVLSIILDLSFLFYFKYFNFLIENINLLFKSHIDPLSIVMPIGISFYTFQAMSYLIDVYRGDIKVQKNILKLALYVTLFPQLVAGPIVKYRDIAAELEKRELSLERIAYGFRRFTIGLAKKVLLANTLGEVADKIFNQPVLNFDTPTAWLGAVCYSLQLFYDFSGYSDMAIGLGAIFGFTFKENFNYPYISKSITEFWRRWHISLSSWFKEYLYIPLGGSRVSKWRNALNIIIVFFVTGLWHGAAWNFIIWGLWHGIFNLMEKLTGIVKKEHNLPFTIFQHLYTILAFVIGWVMFRADTSYYGLQYIARMFGLYEKSIPKFQFSYYIDRVEIAVFALAILFCFPILKNFLLNAYKRVSTQIICDILLLGLLVVSISFVAASTYNPFIYFRF